MGGERLTVHLLFEAQAAKTPQSVALSCGAARVTYAELNARSNQLARYLIARGVQPGTFVALCFERSIELIVAILATLKAGAAYLPLDAAYPPERLTFMLDDAAPAFILFQEALASRLPPSRVGRASIAAAEGEASALSMDNGERPGTPEDRAYVMYTSGSTGKPKGVEVPHRAIARLVQDTDYIAFDPGQVFLQLAPTAFDASTLEIWGPLLNGGRLAVMPGVQTAIDALGRALRDEGVTTLWLTAGLFHLVVDQHLEILRPLKQLLAGGDVLGLPQVRKFLQAMPHCRLVNGYGPTENTTFTCCHTITEADLARPSIPIGKPICGTQVHVLDPEAQAVPAGTWGELYAGGDGVALGYLKRPDLTRERFLPNPFGPGLLYRTGDRVRQRPDGVVEFQGRVDTQVKIRGYRIELGEIESALADQPSVAQAVVDIREPMPGDKRLFAYVVSRGPRDSTPLRNELGRRLPDYMIPSGWLFLDQLPLNTNGKVDRHALAKLPAPSSEPVPGSVAPRSQLEATIARTWCDVLALPQVPLQANFFELGGSSLHLVEIHSRLTQALSRALPVTDLFQFPTVEALAQHLGTEQDGGLGGGVQARAQKQREAMARQQQLKGRRR